MSSPAKSERPISAWRIQWTRFRRQRISLWSFRLLVVFAFLALFGDFLANEKPLYCQLEGRTYFPVALEAGHDLGLWDWPGELPRNNWKGLAYQRVIWPPIPYSARTVDVRNMSAKGPFDRQQVKSWRWRHWLGTDQIGRDLLAGLIRGTRIAMLVGFIAMALATAVGLPLGLLAGYLGDRSVRKSYSWMVLTVLGIGLGGYYAMVPRGLAYQEGHLLLEMGKSLLIFCAIVAIFHGLAWLIDRSPLGRFTFRLPVDSLVMRLIELFRSIPLLLLVLSLIAVIPSPNTFFTMAIIGLVSWPLLARFARSEVLRIREMAYIDATRVLGFSRTRILFRHILPNAINPLLVALAFGFAEAILLESSLSFLGLGVSAEEVTWGSLLASARTQTRAWWLAIFPGLAIFLTVLAFNYLGEGLSEAWEPKR